MTVSDLLYVIVALVGVVFFMFNARQKRMDEKLDRIIEILPAQTAKLTSVERRVTELEKSAA